MPKLKENDIARNTRLTREAIRLGLYRKEMTQKDLAKRLGVSEQTVCRMVHDPQRIRLGDYWDIQRILGITEVDKCPNI